MELKKDEEEKDYILKDNKKTNFGIGFIITILLILVVAVVISGFYFGFW